MNENVNRKINILKHRKKQAANDAQLLMNRIGLLQKEEDRARKKIDQTKERAEEILAMRSENERRIQQFIDAAGEERILQRELQQRNKQQDGESRRVRSIQAEIINNKKREGVVEMQMESQQLMKSMLGEQERELRMKQKKRDEVRRMEEQAKQRKEEERRELERRAREHYEKKAADEESEALRAEKLVKMLERKEREWIAKLQQAQEVQTSAYKHLEVALVQDLGGGGGSEKSNTYASNNRSPQVSSESNRDNNSNNNNNNNSRSQR